MITSYSAEHFQLCFDYSQAGLGNKLSSQPVNYLIQPHFCLSNNYLEKHLDPALHGSDAACKKSEKIRSLLGNSKHKRVLPLKLRMIPISKNCWLVSYLPWLVVAHPGSSVPACPSKNFHIYAAVFFACNKNVN